MRKFKNAIDDFVFLPEGTKVKIDYNEITKRPDYNKMSKAYKDFIEENKDKIFTVEYDKKYQNKPYLVCLKEDTTPLKWLWHSTLDLIVIDDVNNNI